jgi:Ni/Fe-hydrogenase subunit HybB-like protein
MTVRHAAVQRASATEIIRCNASQCVCSCWFSLHHQAHLLGVEPMEINKSEQIQNAAQSAQRKYTKRSSNRVWIFLREFLGLVIGSTPMLMRVVTCWLSSGTGTTPPLHDAELANDFCVCAIIISGFALMALFPLYTKRHHHPPSVIHSIVLLSLLGVIIVSAIVYGLVTSGQTREAVRTSIWLYGTAVVGSLTLAMDRDRRK